MPDSAPVQPDEVPAAIEAAALTAFCGAIGYSDRERVRAAVAAALTLAREDIAARVEGERVLTNQEMTAVRAELDDIDGDPGRVYVAYAARMIREWPGGHRG